MLNQTTPGTIKIPGMPLKDIVYNFEQYCENTTFNLQDNIDILKNMLPNRERMPASKVFGYATGIIYNRKSVSLLPLLEDLSLMMHYLYEASEEEELDTIWMYDDMEESRHYIQDKYDIVLDTAEGDSRVTFMFDNFVIKCDKIDYSSQTYDECNEYIDILIGAALSGEPPYALLPLISFMNVNEITFQIFPRAKENTTYHVDIEWLKLQNYLRYQLIGEGICIDPEYSDLDGDNIGIYKGNLYIIDAGSIQDFINQSGYEYIDYLSQQV